MPIEATAETFEALVREGPVLVDIWGPRCAPCLALAPSVEELERRWKGRFRLVKLNAPENRGICRDLRVLGLPTYITLRDGQELERLSGAPTAEDIELALERMLDAAR